MHRVIVVLVGAVALLSASGVAAVAADTIQCGVISNYQPATASTAGSFNLATASGQVKVAVTAGQVGTAANYVCVAVTAGANGPVLGGFLTPGTAGYIPQLGAGQLPSTSTEPTDPRGEYSTGFALFAGVTVVVLIIVIARRLPNIL